MGGKFASDSAELRQTASKARGVHRDAADHATPAHPAKVGHAMLQSAVEAFASHSSDALAYREGLIADLADRLSKTADTYEGGDSDSASMFGTVQGLFG